LSAVGIKNKEESVDTGRVSTVKLFIIIIIIYIFLFLRKRFLLFQMYRKQKIFFNKVLLLQGGFA
jgi:hypothetical protein